MRLPCIRANYVSNLQLQKTHNLQEIQSWLVDMLEEVKINYVKKIAEGGMEKVVEEAENLRYQVTILR